MAPTIHRIETLIRLQELIEACRRNYAEATDPRRDYRYLPESLREYYRHRAEITRMAGDRLKQRYVKLLTELYHEATRTN